MSERKQAEPYLREVEPGDTELLFCWANEEEVRKNSFHSEVIFYEEHQKWFEQLMHDRNQFQYIMMLGEKPIGQVRLSVFGDSAEIGYSISKEKRGQGYGTVIVCLIKEVVQKNFSDVKKLVAKVKPDNMPSVYCVKKNKFIEKFSLYELDMSDHKEKLGGGYSVNSVKYPIFSAGLHQVAV